MIKPSHVFIPDGVEEHRAHVYNLKKALFWLRNNNDDLHIDTSDKGSRIMELVNELEELLEDDLLLEGDGELCEYHEMKKAQVIAGTWKLPISEAEKKRLLEE